MKVRILFCAAACALLTNCSGDKNATTTSPTTGEVIAVKGICQQNVIDQANDVKEALDTANNHPFDARVADSDAAGKCAAFKSLMGNQQCSAAHGDRKSKAMIGYDEFRADCEHYIAGQN